jgi:hypothetical protein
MENTDKIVESLVEISLNDPQDFLKIRGKYYITHFKELFALDGLPSKMTDDDYARRNTIVGLLAEWNLVKIVDEEKCQEPLASLRRIKIISHKNRHEWELIPKYHIGRKPSRSENETGSS